ncbi:hypothetical protein B0A54_14413 [Friedmanniomyces endolithicus]|uniref:Uncharacterized protein n=1 Tax=Friedmanniomyces endolithicus TaxID=329885 RepID=A0A4U0UCS8_9PEZI|nr:hypothetical protein B0A54_14413 [Friedmanniomyces endolithicus]
MTGIGLLRTLFRSRQLRTNDAALKLRLPTGDSATTARCDTIFCQHHCRCFAHVNDINRTNRDAWFTSSIPRYVPPGQTSDHKPPDERTLQLGKTVRILHDRLPTLLQSPLPAEILSPQISLHLFPSTHPHLPTLTILSERMARHGGSAVPLASRDEKLIVKWKTCGKRKNLDPTGGIYRSGSSKEDKDPMDRIIEFIAGTRGGKDEHTDSAKRPQSEDEREFCGLFVFEFDEKGRIVKHVIEHTDEGGRWDSMTRVVSVTDWLLGHINGRNKAHIPELALCGDRPTGWRIRPVDRRPRLD